MVASASGELGVSCSCFELFGVFDHACNLLRAHAFADGSQSGFLLFLETATKLGVGFEAQSRAVDIIQQVSLNQIFKVTACRRPVVI